MEYNTKYESLKYFNSLRIDAYGTIVKVFSENGIKDLIKDYPPDHFHYVILGNGSNILLTKEKYDADVIFVVLKHLNHIEIQGRDMIVAQAGCTLHDLAWFAYENGLEGLSFLEDIPGCVGGALVMNAGTYSDTIGKFVEEISYIDVNCGKTEQMSCTEDMFSKRSFSLAKDDRIITSVKLKMNRADDPAWYDTELDHILEIKRQRYGKQPRNYPNAGSVFVRPQKKDGVQYYVWQLLEQSGLRGYRIGDACVSEKHPGFMVNVGNASPKDFLCLIDECKKRVKENFGIELALEWKLI